MTAASLVGWDARRAWTAAVGAGPLGWAAILVALGAAGGLARSAGVPDLRGAGEAARWGFVVAAPVAFFSYGILLRPADGWLLRHMGVPAGAIFARQALRLAGLVALAGVVVAAALAGRAPVGRALALTLAAGSAAAGAALLAYAGAARSVGGGAQGVLGGLVTWDRELAAAAPLVYAPLVPLLAGIAAAGWAAHGNSWGRALLVVAAAGGAAGLAARAYAGTLGRWMPVLAEMAFAPPPDAGTGELAAGRGVARLLPRAAAAAWARDAAVARRRFRWAGRLAWPVAGLGVLALARAGGDPGVRGWVAAVAGLAVAGQLGAVLALGQYERAGRRWLDRSLGITAAHRLLGRWMFGMGLSAWLVLPLALAWGLAVPDASGWPWMLAAAGAAGCAALASVVRAG